MKRRYNEIMEHIEVTPEMHRRVLERIREKAVTPSSKKVLLFPAWKKVLPVAACLILLLTGTVILPRIVQDDTTEPPVFSAPSIEEASSLRELAGWVGFDISETFELPFEPAEISYISYWRELAQIEYRSGDRRAVFRKSAGTEDNSGDYSIYADLKEIRVGGQTVTLKGNEGSYSLAVWTDGEFACSLSLSPAIGEAGWKVVLAA